MAPEATDEAVSNHFMCASNCVYYNNLDIWYGEDWDTGYYEEDYYEDWDTGYYEDWDSYYYEDYYDGDWETGDYNGEWEEITPGTSLRIPDSGLDGLMVVLAWHNDLDLDSGFYALNADN